jgi:hypothetical protein
MGVNYPIYTLSLFLYYMKMRCSVSPVNACLFKNTQLFKIYGCCVFCCLASLVLDLMAFYFFRQEREKRILPPGGEIWQLIFPIKITQHNWFQKNGNGSRKGCKSGSLSSDNQPPLLTNTTSTFSEKTFLGIF